MTTAPLVKRSPGSASSTARAASGAVRTSTTQLPSSSRVAACRTTRPRRLPTASSSPATVAELLTTTTSPARSCRGRSRNRAWVTPSGLATSSFTASRSTPRASAGAGANAPAGGENTVVGCGSSGGLAATVSKGSSRIRMSGPDLHGYVDGPVAPRGRSLLEQLEEVRHDGARQRPVGDVLVRECVLVHRGAHVAGVDGVSGQALLGGPGQGQVVERSLGRAVRTPGLVVLHGGVGGQRDQHAVRLLQAAEHGLCQRERGLGVDC